ncbi:MAG: pantoate--beta-alanine ligase [Kiritimatiellaeota bacterium]|nr:pantoate--beta-alanine ligase [Kiritimatiellota bacterium]
MKIITSAEDMQKTVLALKRAGKRIGLVPTMGFLHEGHLSLVKLARQQADVVVLSIFVNPTQFGPNEDFSRYPRNFERDRTLCEAAGVDIVFTPTPEAMYPAGYSVYVEENALSKGLCGASRPGHFRGVLTVVAKLFNLTLPDVVVFGQKDAQQARLIQQMARDLNFSITIVLAPIIREADGLAMSSRNTYLSPAERREALGLQQALKTARRLYREGERDARRIIAAMQAGIEQIPSARVDYIAVVDLDMLQPVPQLNTPVLVALAVYIGKTRLIDNLTLPDDSLSNLPE